MSVSRAGLRGITGTVRTVAQHARSLRCSGSSVTRFGLNSPKRDSRENRVWEESAATYECYGARGRTRTGTGLPPKDFKSFASTIPPLGRKTGRLVVRARNRNRSDEPRVSRARSVRSDPALPVWQEGRVLPVVQRASRAPQPGLDAGISGQDRPWLSAGRQTRVLWRAGTKGRRSSCCRGLWQRPYAP